MKERILTISILIFRKRLIPFLKLQAYCIGGNVLSRIHDFLKDRKQRVVLDGFKIDWSDVISGGQCPEASIFSIIHQ